MLRELTIENYALIDRLSLEFGGGLTALTGETGAGKSIIVGALALALGSRSDAGVIRAGAEAARIDCVFDLSDGVEEVLGEAGYGASEDRTLILSRSVSADGRSRCWVNGRPSTVGALAEIGDMLVDFHGQHEHQQLYRPATHIDYLDRYGGDELAAAKKSYQDARVDLFDCAERLRRAEADAGNEAEVLAAARQNLFTLESAAIADPGEDEELIIERAKLRNVSKIHEALVTALALLDGHDNSVMPQGVIAEVSQAERALASISEFDPMLAQSGASLSEVAIVAGELVRDLRDYQSRLIFSPDRLSEVEDRLALLKKIKEEYGPTLSGAIDQMELLRIQVGAGEGSSDLIRTLRTQHQERLDQLDLAGGELTALRKRFGVDLSQKVTAQLSALALEGARFRVNIRKIDSAEPPAIGMEHVEFVVASNPGEPEQPLAKVISGGEASRIMLAIKLALRGSDPVDTLVFDEIDAGIGGHTATAIGSKLASLSSSRQVICITHLAQIASFAGDQFHVDKFTDGGRTVSKAVRLGIDDRVDEIARMLGGKTDSSAGRAHAQELLERASNECIKE